MPDDHHRHLILFLKMVNKYLELGYFPRAWKVTSIKVIPKPSKDDYTHLKSYRPIGFDRRSVPIVHLGTGDRNAQRCPAQYRS
ncbi:hypothetical protein EVAR_63760_1 [Eumeta japonica]|uniref:RNA-directed DNA polymerase from mobile element jockey n=1 Tax=Eumeta variegata TaxID=151549 RepID=A0A4C1ZT59_EUMVA|nr:hypothetical protein EVAR_63760_1 [Eumeta japonica]